MLYSQCVLFFMAFSPRGFSVPYGHCGHLEILFRSIITRSAAAGWSWAEQKEVEGTPADPCLFTDPGGHPGVTSDKTSFQPHLIRLNPAQPGCLYLRPGGHAPIMCRLPIEILAVEKNTHRPCKKQEVSSFLFFPFRILLHGNP